MGVLQWNEGGVAISAPPFAGFSSPHFLAFYLQTWCGCSASNEGLGYCVLWHVRTPPSEVAVLDSGYEYRDDGSSKWTEFFCVVLLLLADTWTVLYFSSDWNTGWFVLYLGWLGRQFLCHAFACTPRHNWIVHVLSKHVLRDSSTFSAKANGGHSYR